MIIRHELVTDHTVVRDVIDAAFRDHAHQPADSEPVEPAIVEALRDANALSLSLVAEDAGEVIGHVAFSRVTIGAADVGWYGLGPLAVRPDRQRQGVGRALIQEGLRQLRARDAAGVVLVGEPEYYGRFGFRADARLTYAGVPSEYFLVLPFVSSVPAGPVSYHSAFSVAGGG